MFNKIFKNISSILFLFFNKRKYYNISLWFSLKNLHHRSTSICSGSSIGCSRLMLSRLETIKVGENLLWWPCKPIVMDNMLLTLSFFRYISHWHELYIHNSFQYAHYRPFFVPLIHQNHNFDNKKSNTNI